MYVNALQTRELEGSVFMSLSHSISKSCGSIFKTNPEFGQCDWQAKEGWGQADFAKERTTLKTQIEKKFMLTSQLLAHLLLPFNMEPFSGEKYLGWGAAVGQLWGGSHVMH